MWKTPGRRAGPVPRDRPLRRARLPAGDRRLRRARLPVGDGRLRHAWLPACDRLAGRRSSRAGSNSASGERGMVTAETAVALPALVALAAVLAWLVGVGIAQVRCVDAARDAARALARGEPSEVATRLARQSAPAGAEVEFAGTADMVEVQVTYAASPPGALLDGWATWTLHADATTPREAPDGLGD